MRIEEVPAHGRYFEEASSVGVRSGTVYGLKTLLVGLRLVLHRAHVLPCAKFKSPASRAVDG
jgi:hypothetical protein